MSGATNGRAIQYRWVQLDKVIIDKDYQRPLMLGRVQGMAGGFDEHLNQPPEVSHRPDGRYACFEGQHRIAVARKRGETKVFCRVHEGLTREEEADYFARFQLERKGLRPFDRWRAQLEAKKPIQVEIDGIVQSHGFKVTGSGGNTRGIAAVTALEAIFNRGGGPHLDNVLGFISDLWDGEPSALSHAMLLGTSTFLLAFGERVGERQVSHLRKYAPIVVLRRAVVHGAPQSAGQEGVAIELQKMAKMTRAKPVRYTKVFGAPPKPAPRSAKREAVAA